MQLVLFPENGYTSDQSLVNNIFHTLLGNILFHDNCFSTLAERDMVVIIEVSLCCSNCYLSLELEYVIRDRACLYCIKCFVLCFAAG